MTRVRAACVAAAAACVLCVATLSAAAPAGPSSVCTPRALELPPHVESIAAVATTADGMFFVAAGSTIWVRGPWGWETAWQAPEQVVAMQAVAAAHGDALLVGTESAVAEVTWTRQAANPSPWRRLRLTFSGRTLASLSVRQIVRGGDSGPVRGYVWTQAGQLVPVRVSSRLEIGQARSLEGNASDLFTVRLSRDWTAMWRYRESRLFLFGPDGAAQTPINVAAAIKSLRPATIRAVWHDARHARLYIGTDYGLTVAPTAPDSPRVTGELAHVASLGLGEIGLVTRIAGRVVVVFKGSAWRVGNSTRETAIAIEDPTRDTNEPLAKMLFIATASSERPGNVTSVGQVADDAIWVRTYEGVWEWTPDAWHLLDGVDYMEPDALRMLPDGARVGADLVGERLTLCVPPSDFTSLRAIREGFGLANVIPDPDGEGFWGLEAPATGPPNDTRGYLRYLTPHGEFPTTKGTVGSGQPFQVARLSWQHPNGRTDWPESEHGGLLLPSGSRWLHVRAGAWRAYDWPASGKEVRELVPSGESSTTAWLGIEGEAGSGRGRVVRLDVTDDRKALEITPTRVACPTGEPVRLAGDDEGHRWLVCHQKGEAWTLHRVHAVDGDPDRQMRIEGLPESPAYVFRQPLRLYALTDHGLADVDEKSGRASYGRLPPEDAAERFVTLAPSPTRMTVPVPSLWTLFARPGSPPSGEGFAYTLSITATGATINPLQPVGGGTAMTAGWVSDADAPGAIVWAAPERGTPHIEWFAARTSGEPLNRTEPLRMNSASEVVRFRRADFKDSLGENGIGDLAIISFDRVAMVDTQRRRPAPMAVPIFVHVQQRGGTQRTFDLRTDVLPETLSHDTTQITVVFGPDYDSWWRPAIAEVRGRGVDQWTTADANGVASLALAAGSSYTVEYRVPDRDGLGFLVAQGVPLRTEQTPTLVPVWVWPIVFVAATTLLFTVSVSARREVLTRLGRRWLFETGHPRAARVTTDGTSIRVHLQIAGRPKDAFVDVTQDSREIERIQSALNTGEDIRVTVDERLFGYPWSKKIGTAWSWGDAAIVAGQIVSLPPTAEHTIVWPERQFKFASLACRNPGRGLPALPRADDERRMVSKQVKDWGADVSSIPDASAGASADDFWTALTTCDAVHVAAHASLSGIEFADRLFAVGDLTPDKRSAIRTRLLILSACQSIAGLNQDASLVMTLVREGVNVIAATSVVDDEVCEAFWVAFFKAFLPGRSAQGIAISNAIRAASMACRDRFAHDGPERWKPTVDSFILYGDPTLQLVLRTPPRLASRPTDSAAAQTESRSSARTRSSAPSEPRTPAAPHARSSTDTESSPRS